MPTARLFWPMLVCAYALAGCAGSHEAERAYATPQSEPLPVSQSAESRAAANAEAEAHDRLPPNDSPDARLSAEIRRVIAGDDTLSVHAKDVEVIARGGHVTLRGQVPSSADKESIERHARRAAGATHVENELQVQP